MKRFTLTALALATAFLVGRLVAPDAVPAHSTERIIELRPGEPRIVHTQADSLTAADVRSIVDEALAARAPVEAPEHPVDTAAFSQARAAVSTGVSDGRWTIDDRDRLRAVLDRLNREQMRDVMTSLFAAINTGRVQLETDGPPT